MTNQSEKIEVAFTVEMIIDLIKTTRNKLIRELLAGESLNIYYKEKFGKDLSVVKKEFLKRDLLSLLIIPLDLAHYGGLIRKLKEENARSIEETNHPLFLKEIDDILGRYKILSYIFFGHC
jgi:hypothetical protein